jgi:GT2 family glycosyltransferase
VISIVIISKDELGLDGTLEHVREHARNLAEPSEILVVDASAGRLGHIQQRHATEVQWLDFEPPAGLGISIPHQRNAGVRAAAGEVIVFIDACCQPEPGWLARLVAPLRDGEDVTVGQATGIAGNPAPYDYDHFELGQTTYLRECATINLAFRREAFETVGGFDEDFAYGSDVDFSWRLRDAGYRLRWVPDAVIGHDWGDRRRQLRRSYVYGRARARLYRKHPARLRGVLRRDPVTVVYPVFLLGLPLTLVVPVYPLLLLIPAWRNRSRGGLRTIANHLMYGLGVLAEVLRL